MDENILEDISPSLLRTLGLREGDIIRVMKYLDAKFDRKKTPEAPQQNGGLFIDKNGNLKTTALQLKYPRSQPMPCHLQLRLRSLLLPC